MSEETKPKVLIVYYTLSKQSGRVADAMAKALEARGCDVTKAMIEFTDERWVPKLSQFPMKRPFPQIASILPAQLRHKTGEIRIPPEAQAGDYDLVLLASPTWWFQTSMPIRSYLESPAGEGDPRRQALRNRVDLSPLLQHQPQAAAEARGEGRRAVHRQDALRRRRRPGQVDALVARVHEARRAAGTRLGAEDAAAEPQARLRGSGTQLRRRRRGQGSPQPVAASAESPTMADSQPA